MLRKGRGFTLIELLVVIAIIAILAAILFPIFINAKNQAKSATDLGNQRQLGMGLMMYADTNGGYYPWLSLNGTRRYFPAYPADEGTTDSGELIMILKQYVKDNRMFYCPVVDNYYERKYNSYDAQRKGTDISGNPNNTPFMFIGYYYYACDYWSGPDRITQAGSPKRILASCIGKGVTGSVDGEGSSGHGQRLGIFTFADGHAKLIHHYNYPYNYWECKDIHDMSKLLMPRWSNQ